MFSQPKPMKSKSENRIAGAFEIKKRVYDYENEVIEKKRKCYVPNEYGDRFIPRRYQFNSRIDYGTSYNLNETNSSTDIFNMVIMIFLYLIATIMITIIIFSYKNPN